MKEIEFKLLDNGYIILRPDGVGDGYCGVQASKIMREMNQELGYEQKPLKQRIEFVLKALTLYISSERNLVIDECTEVVRNLITDNCEDHTPFRGACVSCGRHDNFEVLPRPEIVIEKLESLK